MNKNNYLFNLFSLSFINNFPKSVKNKRITLNAIHTKNIKN